MPEIYTVREAAERLRVHPVTLRLWLAQGRVRGVQVGGAGSSWRIPASEIERLLEPSAA